jgi:large subunit ribosomal protein L10
LGGNILPSIVPSLGGFVKVQHIRIFCICSNWRQQVNREEKAQLLAELNELFNNSESIVVSHYKGLTVEEVSELRDNIRKAGAGFRVTKNRITRLALKGTKFEALSDLFVGPTAIAFANDPLAACKACVEFAKTNEKLLVLGGAMGTGVLSVEDIKRLASIPSMDELRAKIIGLLQAPGAQLARVTKAYSEKEAE